MKAAKTTQQDPTLTARLVRLRTALFNVARWRTPDGSRVCFCDFEGRPFHSEECEEAADALDLACGKVAEPKQMPSPEVLAYIDRQLAEGDKGGGAR